MISRLLAGARSVWSNLVRRREVEAALDDELRAYVDLLAAEHVRNGMGADAARRAALVEVGGVEQVKEATRDAWLGSSVASAARELRYAVRSLRRAPTFTMVAMVTLGVGIGGATAVFTVVKGSLLRPLPGAGHADRLVTVERVTQNGLVAELSYPDLRDLRARSRTLSGLAGYNGTSMVLRHDGQVDRRWVSYVTDDFFAVLDIRPALGRLFGTGGSPLRNASDGAVAVLGHDLWVERFASNPSVIGTSITLNGVPLTIIGVAPAGFYGAMQQYRMEMFIPIAAGEHATLDGFETDLTARKSNWLRAIGRLAPGATREQAEGELNATASWLTATYPDRKWKSLTVLPGGGMTHDERDEISRVPRLLGMAVALLLLIACANVASLSLVRATGRRRELATRLALGASRAVLIRQVTIEGTVIATGAGLLGILLARLLVQSASIVQSVVPLDDPDLTVDPRVLWLAVGASVLTALLVSLVPALQVSRVPIGAVLKDGGRGVVGRRTGQRVLVGAQVAASLVLLTSAAIVFSTFRRVVDGHRDIAPGQLTLGGIHLEPSVRDTVRQRAFYRAVLPRVESVATVESAALTTSVPPLPWSDRTTIYRRGEEPPPNVKPVEAHGGLQTNIVTVSASFFAVMRLPILRGRGLLASDDGAAPRVTVVSRHFADLMWPHVDPIGQMIVQTPGAHPIRVVGVVGDARDLTLSAAAPPAMYVPMEQVPATNLMLVARTRSGALQESELRAIAASIDPAAEARSVRPIDWDIRVAVRPQQTASAWTGVFGVIGLLLAVIGLYGVVAQEVIQRTREIAVRSALGATPANISRWILGDGLRVAALGAVLGIVGAFGAHRVLRSLFAGVGGIDAGAAITGALALLIALVAATYLPARRASRLSPVDALRSD